MFDCDHKYGDFVPIERFNLDEIGIPDEEIRMQLFPVNLSGWAMTLCI